MDLYNILFYISATFWLILGIRQFKGKWGWFFLILGTADLIARAGSHLINLPSTFYYPMSTTLQIFALYYLFFEKHKFIIFPISLLLLIPGIYLPIEIRTAFLSILLLFIFSFFIRKFILELFHNKKLNLFLITFSTYWLINVLKIIMIRLKLWEAVDLFYMATMFQLVIMIPFLFIRHDDERLSININRTKENQDSKEP